MHFPSNVDSAHVPCSKMDGSLADVPSGLPILQAVHRTSVLTARIARAKTRVMRQVFAVIGVMRYMLSAFPPSLCNQWMHDIVDILYVIESAKDRQVW